MQDSNLIEGREFERARLTPKESQHLADVGSSLRQIVSMLPSMGQSDQVELLRHLYIGLAAEVASLHTR